MSTDRDQRSILGELGLLEKRIAKEGWGRDAFLIALRMALLEELIEEQLRTFDRD